MKMTQLLLLGSVLAATAVGAEEPALNQPPAPPSATESANATATGGTSETTVPEPILLPNGEPGLRLNFRNVPLDLVLNYLSEAAGFIIVLDTKVSGKIDAWSNQPLSKEEAVDLLNSVLNRNGYAAIRNGRTLTIVNKDDARYRDIPVVLESDPDRIPKTDEMVTQIIPVRFVEVAQLLKDLQPLVSTTTTMTANEAGNSIIITDTRANINRVAQIIQAIDQGAEEVTVLRVFRLEYADPNEMATVLTGLFPDDSRANSQSPVRFGGPGGLRNFFRGGGDNNAGGGNSQSDRLKKRARVIAVPDPRTSSIIVSATSGLMGQIEEMVRQLDSNPARKQKVYVYQVDPGDVAQVQQVLKDMFENNTNNRNSRNSQSLQNNVLQNRATRNSQVTGSTGGTFGGNNRTGAAR